MLPVFIPGHAPATSKRRKWRVRRAPASGGNAGLLDTGNGVFRCVLGRGGISARKREGDGATPAAPMKILGGYRNPQRVRFAPGANRLAPASMMLGWCDEPGHASYNRPVRLPFRFSHESMRRDDRLYDVCLVLDWNLRPRSRRRGSAIFLHQTSPDRRPTAGCIALDPPLMRKLLPRLTGRTIAVLP